MEHSCLPSMPSGREVSALSDFANAHQRKQNEYSLRLPTPPRIIIPPPQLSDDGPVLSVTDLPSGDADLSFLKELDLDDIIQKNTLVEWSYPRRRQAQLILPWLYLGPMVAAKDKDFLAQEEITMALAVRTRENSLMGAIQASLDMGLEVATVEAPTFHDLIGHFDQTISLINNHVAQYHQLALKTTGQPKLGKVLVFCESGNEKSAAVAAAYLMGMLNNFDHVKAMQICQAQRFCVNFDDTLKHILRAYWDIIQARRLVATCNASSAQANGHVNDVTPFLVVNAPRLKRSMEDVREDEDMDMADGMDPSDALRFAGRDATPFADRDG